MPKAHAPWVGTGTTFNEWKNEVLFTGYTFNVYKRNVRCPDSSWNLIRLTIEEHATAHGQEVADISTTASHAPDTENYRELSHSHTNRVTITPEGAHQHRLTQVYKNTIGPD